MTSIKAFLLMLVMVVAVSATSQAGFINDDGSNWNSGAAINVDGAFSLGPNVDIGPNPTLIPWVTITRDRTIFQFPSTKVDWYEFTVTTPGLVVIDVDHTAARDSFFLDTYIRLYTPADLINSYASNDDSSPSQGGAGSGSATREAYLPFTFLPAGVWLVEISESQGNAPGFGFENGDTYQLQISVANHAVPEPGLGILLSTSLLALLGIPLVRSSNRPRSRNR